MLEVLVFWLLGAALLLDVSQRQALVRKPGWEWLLDLSNLLIQGLLIPWLRLALVWALLAWLWPAGRGLWQLSDFWGFVLCFVGVDYLYYWNHRLLHQRRLFPLHLVHHTVTRMDVLATSRNTLWSSLLLVYLWVNGLLLYLSDLNAGFVLAMSVTACLDMWKHSPFLRERIGLQQALARYLGLMTPLEHAWHHGARLNFNFGANFNLFDRLHGTYAPAAQYPERLGVQTRLSRWRLFFFPFQS